MTCTKCGAAHQRKHSYCKPCMRTYENARRARAGTEGRRREAERTRLRTYGLTQEQYDAMLVESCGLCAVCTSAFTETQTPNIDHCHATSRVRGLLCRRCNRALGLLRDDVDILRAGVLYLEGVMPSP